MKRFNVGDVVRVVKASECNSQFIGKTYTIKRCLGNISDITPNDECYDIGLPGTMHAEDSTLELIYDGNEKSTWNECAWQPKSISPHPSQDKSDQQIAP